MRMCFYDTIGEIDSLPGCSQVAISHSVFAKVRGNGNGSKAHEKRLEILKELGYDYVICTAFLGNGPQISILNKFGWTMLDSFQSSKTGNVVGLFGKKI